MFTSCPEASPSLPIVAAGSDPRADLAQVAAAALNHARGAARSGRVSTQIPELAKADPESLGLAIALLDGTEIALGDAETPFSTQSITKLFALCALLRHEPTAWQYVGWDASGAGFGSVSEIEAHRGQPRNPFVNAGALVVTDRLLHHTGDAVAEVEQMVSSLAGVPVLSDPVMAASEAAADHRNRAIAHVLAEHGRLLNSIEDVLAQYFAQCALRASALAIARASLFLADRTGTLSLLDSSTIRRVNAVLLTAGMYGAAGDIAYRVGLPAKSGIGGGVIAVMPGTGVACAWSPPLDTSGNSPGGVAAIEEFARQAGWSVF